MGWEPRGSSADGVSAIARIGDIGCRVDGGGSIRGVAPRVHPDAEAVMADIERIPDCRAAGLVLLYARQGERPEWSTGQQVLQRVPVADARRGGVRHRVIGEWERAPTHSEHARLRQRLGLSIVDHYGRSLVRGPLSGEQGYYFRTLDDGAREVLVKHCPVEPWPSTAWIKAVNDMYSTWHAGMMALLDQLLGVKLRDHRLTGFSAPPRPWV